MFLNFIFMCIPLCLCGGCAPECRCQWRREEGIRSLELEFQHLWATPCQSWELDSGSLQEQYELLTERSLCCFLFKDQVENSFYKMPWTTSFSDFEINILYTKNNELLSWGWDPSMSVKFTYFSYTLCTQSLKIFQISSFNCIEGWVWEVSVGVYVECVCM